MDSPYSEQAIAALMQQCSVPAGKKLALAISGGPDSMALLLLAKRWAAANGNTLYALTVDHGLRAESASEAAQVTQWCAALGIEHHTLHWRHGTLHGGIQEKARSARYALMMDWCRTHNVQHILTGHHQDDQIETFLLRLLRGSGVEGLSAMLPVSVRHDITLHRPLLSQRKKLLVEFLHHAHQHAIDDPSNHQNYYTRNRVRQITHMLSDVQRERIIKVINSFYNFRKLMENKLSELLTLHGYVDNSGYATLAMNAYMKLPIEFRLRLIQHLCHTISGNGESLRLEKIARLDAQMTSPSPTSKHTLHGVVFIAQPKNNRWLIIREAQKVAPRIPVTHQPVLWDNRFLIQLPQARKSISIGKLGVAPRAMRRALTESGIPKAVWPTLPALFALEECIAIPHIHTNAVNIHFIPAKPLEAERFFAINNENPLFVRESHRA